MTSPAFTNIDARDLWNFAQTLELEEWSFVNFASNVVKGKHVVAKGIYDEMGLSMLKIRLESIAKNLQRLDERAAHAFRDGELQAIVRSAERSNVIEVEDVMTEEISKAIESGRIKVQKVLPTEKQALSTTMTVDDLELEDLED